MYRDRVDRKIDRAVSARNDREGAAMGSGDLHDSEDDGPPRTHCSLRGYEHPTVLPPDPLTTNDGTAEDLVDSDEGATDVRPLQRLQRTACGGDALAAWPSKKRCPAGNPRHLSPGKGRTSYAAVSTAITAEAVKTMAPQDPLTTNVRTADELDDSDEGATEVRPRQQLQRTPRGGDTLAARPFKKRRLAGNPRLLRLGKGKTSYAAVSTATTAEAAESEDDGVTTSTAASAPLLPDSVFMCKEKRYATPSDLFDLSQCNIRVGTTTYACSHVAYSQERLKWEIKKVYCCAMVNGPEGWVSMPSCRQSKKSATRVIGKALSKGLKKKSGTTATGKALTKCRRKIAGYFRCDSFYFRLHGSVGHACQLKHGGCRSDPDRRPPLMTITAPPSWGITDTVIKQMITALESCPETWWEPLPKQGKKREWLKRIGEASTPAELDLKRQIEGVMMPYFDFIKAINPEMTAWKVGALCTKSGAPSQYDLQASTLHRDYSEAVLNHPPRERPMSIIVALDGFSFFVKPPLPSDGDDYVDTMVERGQAVLFTNEQLHAGGPNRETRTVYRLFAYVVSDEADFPNAEVYPNTLSNQAKMHAARLDDGQRGHLRTSGRTRGSTRK
jgi:hypothetical protein